MTKTIASQVARRTMCHFAAKLGHVQFPHQRNRLHTYLGRSSALAGHPRPRWAVARGQNRVPGPGDVSPASPDVPLRIEFAWDPVKAASNLRKHGVSFATAASVLLDRLALTVFDAKHSDLEQRWFTLGICSEGRLLAVSHTYATAGPGAALVRIISAREATRHERRQYEDGTR